MFIFDLFLLLIIPVITINAFRFVREKWFKKLNSKFLQILLLIALWFLVWFILGLPYRLVTITDWNFPIYIPMMGGYE